MSLNTLSTVDARTIESPIFTSANQLKLAVFCMNVTRGSTPRLAEGSIYPLNWPQQVRIAQSAEEAGFEALLPIGRWRGYPGPSNFNSEQLDGMPWAAGLASLTKKIILFSTAHVPLLHPVRAAKISSRSITYPAGGQP